MFACLAAAYAAVSSATDPPTQTHLRAVGTTLRCFDMFVNLSKQRRVMSAALRWFSIRHQTLIAAVRPVVQRPSGQVGSIKCDTGLSPPA